MTAAQRKLKRANERRQRLWPIIQKARWGKLANSKLVSLIVSIWRLRQLPAGVEEEEWNYSDRETDLASLEADLAKRLLQAVITRDAITLREVAQTAERFNRHAVPVKRLHLHLLIYFIYHETGTIQQLLTWGCPRMGWEIGKTGERETYARRIRNACKDLNIPIVESESPGRGGWPK